MCTVEAAEQYSGDAVDSCNTVNATLKINPWQSNLELYGQGDFTVEI